MTIIGFIFILVVLVLVVLINVYRISPVEDVAEVPPSFVHHDHQIIRAIVILFVFIQSANLYAQDNDSISKKSSIVYFTRTSSLGNLINFTYFDGEKVIGKSANGTYIRYECAPGPHLFWARSENKSFIEAELEGGKIYVIDAIPQLGGYKARVKLIPVDKTDYKLKKIQILMERHSPEVFEHTQLSEIQNEMEEVIERGIERYNELKSKGKEFRQLKAAMIVTETDLVYVRK